ncbi:hypothetical protein SCG7086_BF_00110 [Chlamydiales bacterium SCGC AG-110-P3]|nr:hypothetical protein SCG7086_BF_00110 [Chlamydiales bacterium SCGC AG-110-P3]
MNNLLRILSLCSFAIFCLCIFSENNLQAQMAQCLEYVPHDCKKPCSDKVLQRCENKEGMVRDEYGYINCDNIGAEMQSCLDNDNTYNKCIQEGEANCKAQWGNN